MTAAWGWIAATVLAGVAARLRWVLHTERSRCAGWLTAIDDAMDVEGEPVQLPAELLDELGALPLTDDEAAVLLRTQTEFMHDAERATEE